jgi:hypothetical protein
MMQCCNVWESAGGEGEGASSDLTRKLLSTATTQSCDLRSAILRYVTLEVYCKISYSEVSIEVKPDVQPQFAIF